MRNEDRDVPFNGQSEYKEKFPAKSAIRDPVNNKDKAYNPLNQPF